MLDVCSILCTILGVSSSGSKIIKGLYLLGVKNLMFARTKIWGYGLCPQVTSSVNTYHCKYYLQFLGVGRVGAIWYIPIMRLPRPEVKCWFCYLLAEWPWTNDTPQYIPTHGRDSTKVNSISLSCSVYIPQCQKLRSFSGFVKQLKIHKMELFPNSFDTPYLGEPLWTFSIPRVRAAFHFVPCRSSYLWPSIVQSEMAGSCPAG